MQKSAPAGVNLSYLKIIMRMQIWLQMQKHVEYSNPRIYGTMQQWMHIQAEICIKINIIFQNSVSIRANRITYLSLLLELSTIKAYRSLQTMELKIVKLNCITVQGLRRDEIVTNERLASSFSNLGYQRRITRQCRHPIIRLPITKSHTKSNIYH